MSDVKIVIEKEDHRSTVLGESVIAYIDKTHADAYMRLIKKTWPSTKIRRN